MWEGPRPLLLFTLTLNPFSLVTLPWPSGDGTLPPPGVTTAGALAEADHSRNTPPTQRPRPWHCPGDAPPSPFPLLCLGLTFAQLFSGCSQLFLYTRPTTPRHLSSTYSFSCPFSIHPPGLDTPSHTSHTPVSLLIQPILPMVQPALPPSLHPPPSIHLPVCPLAMQVGWRRCPRLVCG